MQEESRRKAHSLASGSAPNQFSTVENLSQKCAKCGMTNHSTQQHWPGRKHPNRVKGKNSPKCQVRQGTKRGPKKRARTRRREKRRKGQRWPKCIIIVEVPDMSSFSSKSINFSCYIEGDKVEWLLDSGPPHPLLPWGRTDIFSYILVSVYSISLI